jgi:hypothetical protein
MSLCDSVKITLVPKRRLSYAAEIIVTQGPGMKRSSPPGNPADAPLGLADLVGNPINAGSRPGKFQLLVERGWNVS